MESGTPVDAMAAPGNVAPPPQRRNAGPPPPRWRELTAGGRAGIVIGLVLVEAVSGVEALVVTSTMPAVLRDLGGIALYGWVFSGYSLAGLIAIPRAGNAADRHGSGRPFALYLGLFALGTLLSGLAPSMLSLAAVRVIQGYGGAGAYTIAYGAVTKLFPARLRPRMLALLAFIWVASALVGPPLGALLATTAGWRWAFLAVLPLTAVAAVLTLRPLRDVPGDAEAPERLPWRWPLQLAVGTGLLLGGLSAITPWTVPGAVAGTALAVHALLRLLPPGTFTLRPGLPAAIAVAFLTNLALFSADSFVPLLITGVRGGSIGLAGVAVMLGTVAWSAGSWWQSRRITRTPAHLLLAVGSGVLAVGIAVTMLGLIGLPLPAVLAGWTVAGAGMGVAFPTVLLVAMESTPGGGENTAMAARFVGGRLGIALGTGLGGVSVALGHALGAPLSAGLAGAFGLALFAGLLATAASPRLRPG